MNDKKLGIMAHVYKGQNILCESRVECARLESEMLMSHVLKKERSWIYLNRDYIAPDSQAEEFYKLIQRRCLGEPVQYIIGRQEFMGLDFYVNKNVLIPRCDTEILVEYAFKYAEHLNRPVNILEIGTGSGAIAVSLAFYLKDAHIVSIDISEAALLVARHNADVNGVADRIVFLQGDLFAPLACDYHNRRFDIFISNPPYVRKHDIDALDIKVRQYEPHIALDGGSDGLEFYRKMAERAPEFLKDDALWAVEVGYDQAGAVADILKNTDKYKNIDFIKDLSGIDRVVSAFISAHVQ